MRRTTRGMAFVIMPVLFTAWVILYWFPDRTHDLWAWTIAPRMTPITMGAGYLGGAWFFWRVTRTEQPYRLVGALIAATIFTTLLGLATYLHWEKFNHGHVSFWAWLFLYVVAPPLLAVLAVLHHRAAATGPPATDADLPPVARGLLGAVGAVQLSSALAWFVSPQLAMQIWPWKLTPLTVRTLAAFVAFTGALLLWPLFDRRWGAVRIGVEAVTIGLVLTGLGALRATADFSGPTTALAGYALALVAVLALVVWVQVTMAARTRPAARPAPSVGS